jgi:hypothetical protein
MKEKDIQNDIRLMVSKLMQNVKLFRNNVGQGFCGVVVEEVGKVRLVLTRFFRIKFGLCNGSSDLIGWTSTVITPEMVGEKVAVFTSIEVKQPKKQSTEEQIHWLFAVRDAGGIAARVDSVESALEALRL